MRGRTIGLAGVLAALALPAPTQAATPQSCPDGAWEHQLLDLTGAGRSSALGFFAAGTKVAVETACRTGVPGRTYRFHLCVRGVGAALRCHDEAARGRAWRRLVVATQPQAPYLYRLSWAGEPGGPVLRRSFFRTH